MKRVEVFAEVAAEIRRQESLARTGDIAWSAGQRWRKLGDGSFEIAPAERLAVLIEEVGEVARCINEGLPGTYTELIHVAAVAVAWATLHQPLEEGARG